MEVTKFDERNIGYFASRYFCNQAPFEDLVQEGWLAALSVSDPTHKYLAIKNAIQEYKRKAIREQPLSWISGMTLTCLPCGKAGTGRDGRMSHQRKLGKDDTERSALDRSLNMIDNLDQLASLLDKANLTQGERETIDFIYFGENLTPEAFERKSKVSKQAIHQAHDRAMQKLRRVSDEG